MFMNYKIYFRFLKVKHFYREIIICKDMLYMHRWMENYLGLLIRRNKCIIECALSTEFEGK